MTNATEVRLAGKLRAAAEAFFCTELSDIVLHRGEQPRDFGAVACAWGRDIYLPADARTNPLNDLELLGHELAHVVQQRQGRVRPTVTLGGFAANDNPDLEREAIDAGWRFANGMDCNWPRRSACATHQAVIQRSVTVGGKTLSGAADLGLAGTVLNLIGGGPAWLNWAIHAPTVNYRYSGEDELLMGVQSGLHTSELLLLRGLGLQVHPLKLLEMELDDLNAIAAAENEADPSDIVRLRAKKVLAKYQLLSQTELAIGPEFLAQSGVAEEPVFQAMGLSDRIALFNLVEGASNEISLNPMIQKEAAGFAVQHAQSTVEFVDYYRFYISTVDEPAPTAQGSAARISKAEAARESTEPLLYGRLFCPSVQSPPTPEQMNTLIQNWVSAGNELGFSRLSRGLVLVSQYANLQGAKGDAASKLIDEYIQGAEQFISLQSAAAVTLTQDGLDRYYSYRKDQSQAQVCLASGGDVTLANYQPKP